MSAQNEELDLFRDMVLRFLEQEIEPHFEEWEKNHMMPREVWNTMGAAGLLLVDMVVMLRCLKLIRKHLATHSQLVQ